MEKTLSALIKGTDEKLGLVFGWAIICTKSGEPYFDTQGDHITEAAMLSAATEYMKKSKVMLDNHGGPVTGTVLFAFPLTAEIAKAYGIESEETGLLIGAMPDDLTKVEVGSVTGFSIGGFAKEVRDA